MNALDKPNFELLRPVQPEDREFFEQKAHNCISDSCEWSFPNLFAWGSVNRLLWMPFAGRILLFDRENHTCYFPIGEEFSPDELAFIVDAFCDAKLNKVGAIYDIPPHYPEAHPRINSLFELKQDQGAFDYIYDLTKLRNLAGAKLRKKRNLVRQFERNNPNWSIQAITPENLSEVRQMSHALNLASGREDIAEEDEVMELAWNNFFACGLAGIILYSEPGHPVGFSTYSKLNTECCNVNFEKADHTVIGSHQMLIWQLARSLPDNFVRMNREQDLNEPGLRQAKQSLDPISLYRRSYGCRRDKNGKSDCEGVLSGILGN